MAEQRLVVPQLHLAHLGITLPHLQVTGTYLTLYTAKTIIVPRQIALVVAVDGWAVTFGTARRELGGNTACLGLLTVPNVTAYASMASVPITVFLYNGPLLCGSNVPVKGLKTGM